MIERAYTLDERISAALKIFALVDESSRGALEHTVRQLMYEPVARSSEASSAPEHCGRHECGCYRFVNGQCSCSCCGDARQYERDARAKQCANEPLPRWSEESHYRAILEKIATTPGCPEPIYNLAADALCWARKHRPEPAPNEARAIEARLVITDLCDMLGTMRAPPDDPWFGRFVRVLRRARDFVEGDPSLLADEAPQRRESPHSTAWEDREAYVETLETELAALRKVAEAARHFAGHYSQKGADLRHALEALESSSTETKESNG